MDVLNEQQLHSVVVDPALTRLNTETIPALKAALNEELVGAIYSLHQTGEALLNQLRLSLDGLLKNAAGDAAGVLATTVGDLHDLVNSLDGWTLDISVRLSKPKAPEPATTIIFNAPTT